MQCADITYQHISAHVREVYAYMDRGKRVKEDKKTHISLWIEGWHYNKIQEEIESGSSETEAEVVRKALNARFKPETGW